MWVPYLKYFTEDISVFSFAGAVLPMRNFMELHYYNRGEAAEFVRGKGLPCAKSTRAKLACIGGGPNFRRFGRNVVYTAFDLQAWIEARLTGPVAHTNDLVPPNGEAVDERPTNRSDSSQPTARSPNGRRCAAHNDGRTRVGQEHAAGPDDA